MVTPQASKSLDLVGFGTIYKNIRHWKIRLGAHFLKTNSKVSIGMVFSTFPQSLIDFGQKITASEHYP